MENILKQAIIFDILNVNFKDKIKEYIESLKPPTEHRVIGEANPIEFPEFKTIYY